MAGSTCNWIFGWACNRAYIFKRIRIRACAYTCARVCACGSQSAYGIITTSRSVD